MASTSYINDLNSIYETMGPERQAMGRPSSPKVGPGIPKGKDIIPPPPGKPPGQVFVKKNTSFTAEPPLPTMLMNAPIYRVLQHAKTVDVDLTEKLREILAQLSRKTVWPTVYFDEK